MYWIQNAFFTIAHLYFRNFKLQITIKDMNQHAFYFHFRIIPLDFVVSDEPRQQNFRLHLCDSFADATSGTETKRKKCKWICFLGHRTRLGRVL